MKKPLVLYKVLSRDPGARTIVLVSSSRENPYGYHEDSATIMALVGESRAVQQA